MKKKCSPSTFISSTKEKQDFWIDKRDKKLEEAYARVAPGIPLVNVNHKNLFLQKCKEYYSDISKKTTEIKKVERWDEFEIIRMFGKGLNPTSLNTALNDIKFFVENLKGREGTLRILEYGPGSGWSTLMLREELKKKFPEKKIEFVSVDMSPHSIVATQNSLDYYQIPWQTAVKGCSMDELDNKADFINLAIDDFIGFTKKQPDDYFDGFFSSHGTAYLSEEEYRDLLLVMKQKGKKDAIFVADSLDPLYTAKLSTLHVLLCSISPSIAEKQEEYVYGKSLISNSKYFPSKEVKKLVKMNNKDASLFYNWNNYLLRNLKFRYILQMLKSSKITMAVIEAYREDVYPSYLLSKLTKEEKLRVWEELDNIPKCPVYITNCGFILKK